MSTGWLPIVKVALHFPASQIELSPGATIETSPVGLTLAGKGSTHFPVPTAEQPSYYAANRAPRRIVRYNVRVIFDDRVLRLHCVQPL